MSDITRPVGSELAGRYRIDGFLKKGGMGAVYRATHLMLNRQVALKLIKPELVESEDTVQRFEREAKAASQLDHPNIVTIHDLGRADDGTLFIAMELVDGRSLRELVAEEGALAPERAAKLARGIARALARAHSRGIVHRDLKPQNIMVARGDDDEEVPKLLDFGIAKSFETDEPALTRTGMVVGTPQYMSPEQAQGLPVDARTDLYALGVILYEMLAGHVPFQDTSVPALLIKHLSAPPPSLNLRRPGLPQGLVAIVERLLAKQPDDRYSGADELVTLLAGPFDAPAASGGGVAAAATTAYPTAPATPPPAPPASPPPPAPPAPPTPAPAPAQHSAGPATAESVAPAPARPRPVRQGPSPLAILAVLAVLALAFGAVVAGGWYWLSGAGEHTGTTEVASKNDAATAGETGPAGEDAAGGGAATGTDAGEATGATQSGPAASGGGTAAAGARGSATATGGGGAAEAPGAPVAREPSGSGSPAGGAQGSGAATRGAGTPSRSAPAAPPPRPAPPPPPASPSVALACAGVGDGCAALQRALHDAFESSGIRLSRPDRAEVLLDVRVEEIEARSEQQFGTTFVVRTYSVTATAEAPRFDELVPMPAPETIRFDTRFGAEKLNEGSRVIASSITDRITGYWGKRVP